MASDGQIIYFNWMVATYASLLVSSCILYLLEYFILATYFSWWGCDNLVTNTQAKRKRTNNNNMISCNINVGVAFKELLSDAKFYLSAIQQVLLSNLLKKKQKTNQKNPPRIWPLNFVLMHYMPMCLWWGKRSPKCLTKHTQLSVKKRGRASGTFGVVGNWKGKKRMRQLVKVRLD